MVSSAQVWDYELERSAEHWAHTCRWEHGPSHMLTQIGQNLGAHWGRYVCEVEQRMQIYSFTAFLFSASSENQAQTRPSG